MSKNPPAITNTSTSSNQKKGSKQNGKSKPNNGSSKSPIQIPPPLVQVDFGNQKSTSANVNGNAKKQSKPKLPSGEATNSNNKPSKNDKNYAYQSLPSGKKPDFGNGKKQPNQNNHQKKRLKDETASDLMKLLGGDPQTRRSKGKKSSSVSPSPPPPASQPSYAGNSFTLSAPSAISLPKPTF